MGKLISYANLLQKSLEFKELNLNQYRQLLKCFVGDEIDFNFIYRNINDILHSLTSLSIEEIKQLSFADYTLLLLNIRQISIGDIVSLYVFDNENRQIKVEIGLQNVINEINNEQIKNLLKAEDTDAGTIHFRLPSIDEILYLEKNQNTSLYTFFLEKIKLTNTEINLETFSFEEREKIVQKLPVKIMTHLTKRTHNIVNTFNNINLFKTINNQTFDKILPFTLNTDILGFVYKLVYNTSIENIYDFMFVLTKAANFSCNFLDSCSPGEFYLFVKKLEQLNAQQQALSKEQNSVLQNDLPPITSEANFDLE
jgi:hypothetical protein